MFILATVAYPVPATIDASVNAVGSASAARAPRRQLRQLFTRLGVLLLAFVAGIYKSTALATRAAARLMEDASTKIIANPSRHPSSPTARVEAIQISGGATQTANGVATGCTGSKEEAPSPTTALVRAG